MTVMAVPMTSPDLPDPDSRPDHLSDVYDPATLAAINAGVVTGGGSDWPQRQVRCSPGDSRGGDEQADGRNESCRPEASPPAPGSTGTGTGRGRRKGRGTVSLAGSLWLGALTGLGEAFGDEDLQPHVGWWVPAATDPGSEAVSVHLVPGAPAASQVVVRPWLLAGH